MIRTASSSARRTAVHVSRCPAYTAAGAPSIARRYSAALSPHTEHSSSSSSGDDAPPPTASTSQHKATSRQSASRLQPRQVQSRTAAQSNSAPAASTSAIASSSSTASTSASAQTSSQTSSTATPSSSSSSSSSSNASPPPEPPKKTWRSRIKDLYAQLKFLFRFYLNGVKQIWRDRQRVAEIRKSCLEERREMTWGEARLAKVHREDIKKLPLFLAILLIVEEVLPLVVIYAPFLLPSTCILPSQLLKIRQGEETKRAAAVERLRNSSAIRDLMASASLPGPNKGPSPSRPTSAVHEELARLPTLSAAAAADLETLWKALPKETLVDLSAVFTLPTTLRPTAALRRNLEKRADFILEDDKLLEASSGQSSSKASTSSSTAKVDLASASRTQTAGRSGDAGQEEVIGGVPSSSATPTEGASAVASSSTPPLPPLANFPSDLPTLSSVLTERGLRSGEIEQGEMEATLRLWTKTSERLAGRREAATKQEVVKEAKAESVLKAAAPPAIIDLLLLPLSLYPPPQLFTPSLSAPATSSTSSNSSLGGEQAPAQQESAGLLEKSKEVVREVVEAEERRERLMKEKEEREKAEQAREQQRS